MDFSNVLYILRAILLSGDAANTVFLHSRLVNLAVGVFMILGGIGQFFPHIEMYALPIRTSGRHSVAPSLRSHSQDAHEVHSQNVIIAVYVILFGLGASMCP